MKRVIFRVEGLAYPIQVLKDTRKHDHYVVRYGTQEEAGDRFIAANKLGAFIFHALCCDGKLDDLSGAQKEARRK